MIYGVKFCLCLILITVTFLSFLYVNLVTDCLKMAKKAKGKKGKNSLEETKKREIKKVYELVQMAREEYEAHLESVCKSTCTKIKKMYEDKLNALPENIRNMTLSEYMEMQAKSNCEPASSIIKVQSSSATDILLLNSVKSKLKSEKKTHKKIRTERKRSLSVSMSSNSKGIPPQLLSRVSRTLSESCLSTPVSKRSAVPAFVVTPKFNLNAPLSKSMMRKPRAGELVMSVSGSPLQNFVDDVSLSLGGGKVFKLTEDQDIAKLESDLAKKLDEDTKTTLENVKKQLDKILQS